MSADQVANMTDAEIVSTPAADLPAPAAVRFSLLDVGELFDAAGTVAAAIASAPDAEPFDQARAVLVGLDAAALIIVKRQ